MFEQIEGAGDLADWPKNVPGKPTQVVVLGVTPAAGGRRSSYEVLFIGQFPNLDKAMYWGGKKELEIIRKGKYPIANRVLWQHDLSPERAAATVFAQIAPQLDRASAAGSVGGDVGAALFGDPNGFMKPIDHSAVDGYIVDVGPAGEPPDDDDLMPPSSWGKPPGG